MLAISRALMGRPKILLLDEPSLGLAPQIVDKIFEIIKQINGEGVTILLVEQNANQALQFHPRLRFTSSKPVALYFPVRALSFSQTKKSAKPTWVGSLFVEIIGWTSTAAFLVSIILPKRIYLHQLGIFTAITTGFYAYEHGATAIWVKWLIAFFFHIYMVIKIKRVPS